MFAFYKEYSPWNNFWFIFINLYYLVYIYTFKYNVNFKMTYTKFIMWNDYLDEKLTVEFGLIRLYLHFNCSVIQ